MNIFSELIYELQTQSNRGMTEKTIPSRYFNGPKAVIQLTINIFSTSCLTVIPGIFTHGTGLYPCFFPAFFSLVAIFLRGYSPGWYS